VPEGGERRNASRNDPKGQQEGPRKEAPRRRRGSFGTLWCNLRRWVSFRSLPTWRAHCSSGARRICPLATRGYRWICRNSPSTPVPALCSPARAAANARPFVSSQQNDSIQPAFRFPSTMTKRRVGVPPFANPRSPMPHTEKSRIVVRPRIRVFRDGEIVMGPGKAELLAHIAETKSLSESARRMKMSYMKAWLLVQTMNRSYKKPLVQAERGGRTGGGARLTPYGQRVLAFYQEMEESSLAAIQKPWAKLRRMLRSSPVS
jgi:molybdate transport system regulatory protein